jgi:hypothetical protein
MDLNSWELALTSYHLNAISSLSLQHLRGDAAFSDTMQPWRLFSIVDRAGLSPV